MNGDEWDQMTGWTQDDHDAAVAAEPPVWPCCKHCPDDAVYHHDEDGRFVASNDHDEPCNAPDPCLMQPVPLRRGVL